MLTVFGSTSAGHARSYFDQGDYYSTDDENRDELLKEQFGGKLADTLGIEPHFDKETFSQLLEGKINEDIQVGRKGKNGQVEHRPGWDLTFSAPKSVSIMGLAENGDPRLVDAHRDAVATAMRHIEENLAFVRRTVGDETVLKKVEELLYASFEHGTSRALDPQLHTHNFVFNFAQDGDKFRSLETKPIYDNIKQAGLIYRNELAYICRQLGYDIDAQLDGTFELSCVPNEVNQNFSKRREEILAAADMFGLEGGKEMQRAALMTRVNKQHVSQDELKEVWSQELSDLNFNPSQAIPSAKQQHFKSSSTKDDLMISINHYSQFEAAFPKPEVVDFSMRHSLGYNSYDNYESGLQGLKKDGVIFDSHFTSTKGQAHHLVTSKALDKERLILELMTNGKERFSSIYNERQIQSHIDKLEHEANEKGFEHGFTEGQAAAFNLALSSTDQFIGVNGRAGTGKTYMQNELRTMLEGAGYNVIGMAPTGAAAAQLESDSGIKSFTIDSFLHRNELEKANRKRGRKAPSKQFWVVDEAGLANAQHFLDLMVQARNQDARVLFQGDIDQLGAVEWGKMFDLLLQHGMSHVEMNEILRQKFEPEKQAVYASLDRDYDKVFRMLNKSVKANSGARDLFNEWKKLPLNERNNSLIIIPDIETKNVVSEGIHHFKSQQGEIGSVDYNVPVLVNNRFSDSQKAYGRFYSPGQVVEFQKPYSSLDVNRGERFVVAAKQNDLEVLHLVPIKSVDLERVDDKEYLKQFVWAKDGKQWNPNTVAGKAKRGVEVFNVEKRNLSLGEEIKWTKSDSFTRNGAKGVISDVNTSTGDMTLTFRDGTKRVLNIDDAHTLDYNYVKTAFVAQGLGAKQVFMLSEFHRRNLVNQKSFYVKLSRMKEKVHLFTNQTKEKLGQALRERTGNKQSAVEHAMGNSLNSSFRDNLKKNHPQTHQKQPASKQNDMFKSPKVNERSRGGFSR